MTVTCKPQHRGEEWKIHLPADSVSGVQRRGRGGAASARRLGRCCRCCNERCWGGGGGGGEAQIHCNSSSGGGGESGFSFAGLHHQPRSGSAAAAPGPQRRPLLPPPRPRRHPRSGAAPRLGEGAGEGGTMPGGRAAKDQAPPPPPSAPLLRWDEVPDDFVECFILSGYRRLHCSAQECLASVLQPTNETLNFWTHFIPLLLFLSKFCRLFFLSGAGELPFHHPFLLPLWCYASGVLLTFAMSCTAHVFSCLSLRLRAAFFYLDYASISYYGFASTVAYSYYLLPGLRLLDARAMSRYLQQRLGWQLDCSLPIALYSALVLPVAFVLAVTCTVACCKSRSEWCAYPFAIRTFVFAMPLSMACPIMLESFLFDLRGQNPTLFVYFYRRYFWLLVAAFFNVSKIPERIQPGLFDIIGHSHQLFHIFTFLSIYDQMYYLEEGLLQFLKSPPASPTFLGTIGYMLLLMLCLGMVIRKFLNVADLCKQD
nr:membrane progestin receptor epsilon [Caretta caretta]